MIDCSLGFISVLCVTSYKTTEQEILMNLPADRELTAAAPTEDPAAVKNNKESF